MKRDRIILVTVIIGLVIMLLLAFGSLRKSQDAGTKTNFVTVPTAAASSATSLKSSVSSSAVPSPTGIETKTREEKVKIVQAIYNAPISFYGRVIDQNGNPVQEAHVEYSAADKFWADGSKYQGLSDGNGYFSINDIKGAGLFVSVSKSGYDPINGKSSAGFGYGMGPDSSRKAPPTKDAPAIFVLRKKAIGEPLFTVGRTFRIPKNGSPVGINLKTAIAVPAGQGDLVIECWTNDQVQDANRHYDWHCRFSVPDGGLVQSKNEVDYQAPTEGYLPSIEISMPHDVQNWRSNASGEYYLKLRNGTYARAEINMIAGGDHFVRITSYLNPQPGSRNLEYDPAKQINPR